MPASRPLPRSVYRRRRIGALVTVALLLGVGFYVPMTLLAPLEPVAAEVSEPDPIAVDAPDVSWPGYGASAVGIVGETGIIGQDGSADALPLASITKVVTALTVLEAHPLAVGEDGPTITMTAEDRALRDHYLSLNGSVSPVQTGWTFSQRDLLELTLIKSANNYAASLAHWAFGSDAGFAEAASAWTSAHGLDSLRIVEPTGIATENIGDVVDLVELGRLALADPVVAEIVGTASDVVAHLGPVFNTNSLLGSLGVDGIKTGTLDSFGANLLFSSTFPVGGEEVSVVGVILGIQDHGILANLVGHLLESVQTGFREVPLTTAGTPFATYSTEWGDTARAVAADDADLLVWGDATVTSEVTVRDLDVGEDGDPVGSVAYSTGEDTVTVELVLDGEIDDPGAGWRLTHPGLIVGAP